MSGTVPVSPVLSAAIQNALDRFRASLHQTVLSSFRNTVTALVFFFSGMAALIYQVLWQRVLTQEIGVDAISVAFIVTIFMMGLGMGTLAGGVISYRFSRYAPIVYAALELSIGLLGIISIPALRYGNQIYATLGFQSVALDFLFNAATLFLPIFLMGATTPVIVDFTKSTLERCGQTVGFFYGVNVLGAALGAILSLFLIELLGLQSTSYVAAAINIGIGIAFLVVNLAVPGFAPPKETAASAEAGQGVRRPKVGTGLRAASFLFGFVNLSLEIVLFRILFFYFAPASFVFPVILCIFLALMAIGQVMGGNWIDATSSEGRIRVLLYLLLLGCGAILLVLSIPMAALDVVYQHPYSFVLLAIPLALGIAFIVMVPAVFFSAYLPAVTKIATTDIRFAGATFSTVLFWSTLGNIVGTFVTAIILFEEIGTIYTFVVLAWAALAAVLIVARCFPSYGVGVNRLTAITIAAVVLFTVMVPKHYFYQPLGAARPFVAYTGTSRPLAVLEGHTTVTSVFFNEKSRNRMEVRPFNSGAAAAIINENAVFYQYYSLAVSQMVDPNFRPRRVLLIGLGSGELPFVMKELPFVEKFVIVELSPEVLEAYERFSDPLISQTLNHSKVEVYATDGRRYVQKALARGEKFDLVQIGIIGLSLAGASNIYSLDFFQKVHQLINPGGYLALEPYIGVARLGFELFPYGYVLSGSSWIFMHDRPLALNDGQQLAVSQYQKRFFNAKSYADLRSRVEVPSVPIALRIIEYEREDVVRMFPTMVGTDDRLIFEYFYLAQLFPGYVAPTTKIQSFTNLKSRSVNVNAYFSGG